MVGTGLIAPKAIRKDRFLRAMAEPLPEYSMSVGIIILIVSRPLTSENAGNVNAGRGEYSGRRRGTCPEEMGKKVSTNCSVSKIALHGKKFVLGAIFGIGELHLSPLHIL